MPLTIEIDQEEDGRWLAEVMELPGVLSNVQTRHEAIDRVQAPTLRVRPIVWITASPCRR
jgi:hypothetical protein